MEMSARSSAMAFVLILTACGHSGLPFQRTAATDPQKSVVYVWRQAKFAGGAVTPEMILDGALRFPMHNGGYVRLELSSGKHELRIDTDDQINKGRVEFDVPAGAEVFLRYRLDPHIPAGALLGGLVGAVLADQPVNERPLVMELVSPAEALRDLGETYEITVP
jgi:hypothetical protein